MWRSRLIYASYVSIFITRYLAPATPPPLSLYASGKVLNCKQQTVRQAKEPIETVIPWSKGSQSKQQKVKQP